MEQTYTTKNGRLILKNGKLWEKKLLKQDPDYAYHSFILLIFFLVIIIDEVQTTKEYSPLLYLWFFIIGIYPHAKTLYEFLFQKIWRWYIPLNEIKFIHYHKDFNELEESVTIIIRNGRSKTFVFRKSEQQALELTQNLEARIPALLGS